MFVYIDVCIHVYYRNVGFIAYCVYVMYIGLMHAYCFICALCLVSWFMFDLHYSTLLCPTANLRTKILDFRGFGSIRILILRGGILMSIGDFPEMWSQRVFVGTVLVGRLGVCPGIAIPKVRIQDISNYYY